MMLDSPHACWTIRAATLAVAAMCCTPAGAARAVRTLAPVMPAEVIVLPLAELGLPDGADTVSVSGAVSEALLKDGNLRFATPADTGAPQQARFILVKQGARVILSQPILSARPVAPQALVESGEAGGGKPLPGLSIAGLGPNNAVTGMPLTFRLETAARLNLAQDSDGLVLGANGMRVSLKRYWVFDPGTRSFSISGARLAQLMKDLPAGALEIALNFVSADGEFAAVYELLAMHARAALRGRLVTPEGAAVTHLAGRKVLLRGMTERLRLAATIDADGRFSVANVVPDTYQLTLDDLERPNVVSARTSVQPGAAVTTVEIVYD